MASTVGCNLAPQIVNTPVYNVKCRYFNTLNGCRYRNNCKYQHITNDESCTYNVLSTTLIQMHQQTNDILRSVLKLLEFAIATIQPATSPTSTTQEIEAKIATESLSALSTPQLQSGPTTPTYSRSFIYEVNKTKLATQALGITIDETPTTKYFKTAKPASSKLTEILEKALFIEWIINEILIDKIDDDVLSELVSKILYGFGASFEDIVTGNKLVLDTESVLNNFGYKYRKILNIDNDKKL